MDQAKVLEIQGQAMVMKHGMQDWEELQLGMILSQGDMLKTMEASEVLLELSGAVKTADVTVREKTEMSFEMFHHLPDVQTDKTLLNVGSGGILVKAEKLSGESKFEVKTPTSIVGIRGTTFEVQVSED